MKKIGLKKIKYLAVICGIILCMTGCRTSTAGYNYESARLQYNQKDYEKALEYINKAINSSKEAEYYIFQGDILSKLDKKKEAVKAYELAITDGTSDADLENNKQAYGKIAITYMELEDYKLANENIDKALNIAALDEITKDLMLYKMDILLYMAEYKEVISVSDEYLKMYTDKADMATAYIKMARAYSCEQNYEKALDLYKKALKNDSTTYYYRAMTYEDMGEYEKAYNDYEAFLKESKADIKYSIYAKQIDCLIEWVEKCVDEDVFEKAEKVVTAGMASQDEKNIMVFGKKYIALLEREGMYEEAYVYAKEYAAEYPEDEAIQKEIKFLETRILSTQ